MMVKEKFLKRENFCYLTDSLHHQGKHKTARLRSFFGLNWSANITRCEIQIVDLGRLSDELLFSHGGLKVYEVVRAIMSTLRLLVVISIQWSFPKSKTISRISKGVTARQ